MTYFDEDGVVIPFVFEFLDYIFDEEYSGLFFDWLDENYHPKEVISWMMEAKKLEFLEDES